MALEAVQRIDALFAIEREINGLSADERKAARQNQSVPLLASLEAWMRNERAKLSRHNHVAKAMDYILKRWDAFSRFLEDGRICLSNNAAERAIRGLALGRKSWLFVGSDRGGERAAMMYSLIVTCKLNDVDPQAWLTDVPRPHRRAPYPQARRAAAVAMEGYEHVQRVRSRGLKTADLSYQGGRPNIRPKDKLKRPPSRLSNPSNVRAVNKFFENGRVGAHRMNTEMQRGGRYHHLTADSHRRAPLRWPGVNIRRGLASHHPHASVPAKGRTPTKPCT